MGCYKIKKSYKNYNISFNTNEKLKILGINDFMGSTEILLNLGGILKKYVKRQNRKI